MTELEHIDLPISPRQSAPRRKPVPLPNNGTEIESLVESSPPGSSHTVSKWGVGWKTPFMMVICYTFAILIASTHLALFLYLDGKPADGQDRVAPQSYVTTASNLLSTIFSLALKTALAVAFTQYLWYTLRKSAMKVSTVESLFTIRSNPLLLFDGLVLASGPFLVITAIMIWSIRIAASFPPGALTIRSTMQTWNQTMNLPTFNALYFGNSSGYDAERYSFSGFFPDATDNSTIIASSLGKYNSFVQSLTTQILIRGAASDMPSPCGANCSFTQVLDIPYLECNTSTFNMSGDDGPENEWITYPDPDEPSTNVSSWAYYITTWTNYTLNATTYVPPYVDGNILGIFHGNNTICSPARASYTLGFTYLNNIQTIEKTLNLVEPLSTTSSPPALSQYAPEFTFPGLASHFNYGTQALNWTESLVSWYRDIQLVALISSMGDALSGSIAGDDTLVADSTTGTFTVAPNTRFNNAYGIYTQREPTTIYQESDDLYSGGVYVPTNTYTVTPDLLNSALMNITLSAMSEFGWWKTNGTSLTQWEAINVYSFSRPLNLIIPYFATLLLALPLLLTGGFALFANGVPAVDGGFLQLLTTTTGSHKLDNLAAGNCLGGKHNVSEELESLRIRFGEFICEEKEVANAVRRAGFGTEDETVPLKKGVVYGY